MSQSNIPINSYNVLSDLDFFIVSEIWHNKITTTWEIAKEYLGLREPRTKEEKWLIRIQNQNIKDRLKRMARFGIATITKSKPNGKIAKNIYTLTNNIKIKKHQFPYCKSEKNAMCLRINKKWEIFEL